MRTHTVVWSHICNSTKYKVVPSALYSTSNAPGQKGQGERKFVDLSIHKYVCTYLCMDKRMYGCMYVCTYVCMYYGCIYVCMHAWCTYVCSMMYLCMHDVCMIYVCIIYSGPGTSAEGPGSANTCRSTAARTAPGTQLLRVSICTLVLSKHVNWVVN